MIWFRKSSAAFVLLAVVGLISLFAFVALVDATATGISNKNDRHMRIHVKREAEAGDDAIEDSEKPIKKSVSEGSTTKGPQKKNSRRSSTKKPAHSSTTTTGAPPASSTASPASSAPTAKAGRSAASTGSPASSTTKEPGKNDGTSTSKPSGKPDSTGEPTKPPMGKEELVALNYALAGTKAWFSALMKQNWNTMHAAKAHELLTLKNIISKNLITRDLRPRRVNRMGYNSRYAAIDDDEDDDF